LDAKGLAALSKYLSDQKLCQQQKDYNASSVYMQIDPENVHYLVLRYFFTAQTEDYWYDEATNRMLGFWKEDAALAFLQQQLEADGLCWQKQDFKELVAVSGGGRAITVTVTAPDDEQAAKLQPAIEAYFNQTILPAINQQMGGQLSMSLLQSYTYSQLERGIRDSQEANINRVNNYEVSLVSQWENMEDGPKAYYKEWKNQEGLALGEQITKSEPVTMDVVNKQTILQKSTSGILPGILGGILFLLIWFYVTPVIYSGKHVEDAFGISQIGDVAADQTLGLHKSMKGLWSFSNRMLTKKGTLLEEAEALFLIKTYREAGKKLVMLTGSLEKQEAFRKNWEEKLGAKDGSFRILSYHEVMEDAKKAKTLKECDLILLAECSGGVSMKRFQKGLKLIAGYHDKICGVMVVS
nr:hypothetical protein [Lachnospiraceae bacterium]